MDTSKKKIRLVRKKKEEPKKKIKLVKKPKEGDKPKRKILVKKKPKKEEFELTPVEKNRLQSLKKYIKNGFVLSKSDFKDRKELNEIVKDFDIAVKGGRNGELKRVLEEFKKGKPKGKAPVKKEEPIKKSVKNPKDDLYEYVENEYLKLMLEEKLNDALTGLRKRIVNLTRSDIPFNISNVQKNALQRMKKSNDEIIKKKLGNKLLSRKQEKMRNNYITALQVGESFLERLDISKYDDKVNRDIIELKNISDEDYKNIGKLKNLSYEIKKMYEIDKKDFTNEQRKEKVNEFKKLFKKTKKIKVDDGYFEFYDKVPKGLITLSNEVKDGKVVLRADLIAKFNKNRYVKLLQSYLGNRERVVVRGGGYDLMPEKDEDFEKDD